MSKQSKKVRSRRKNRPASPNPSKRSSRAQVFSPDYSHIVQDLKRIGFLAGTIIIILIALSFII